MRPHLPIVKDTRQTFWRYSGRDGSVGQWVVSSAESEDTVLSFNHGSQRFIRALSMEHVAAAEA